MTVGMIFAAVSFVIAGILQIHMEVIILIFKLIKLIKLISLLILIIIIIRVFQQLLLNHLQEAQILEL